MIGHAELLLLQLQRTETPYVDDRHNNGKVGGACLFHPLTASSFQYLWIKLKNDLLIQSKHNLSLETFLCAWQGFYAYYAIIVPRIIIFQTIVLANPITSSLKLPCTIYFMYVNSGASDIIKITSQLQRALIS